MRMYGPRGIGGTVQFVQSGTKGGIGHRGECIRGINDIVGSALQIISMYVCTVVVDDTRYDWPQAIFTTYIALRTVLILICYPSNSV